LVTTPFTCMDHGNAVGISDCSAGLSHALALLVQIAVVAAGVGVLFATTPWAFLVVKWFGVGYLLYLAILQWKAPAQSIEIKHELTRKSRGKLVLHGFLVNITNPKAIVFLLAVLPQF
jgi:homoserine/homoserine lactone efflux protein